MSPILQGTVALVTGASGGIGAATARALADAGAELALVARRVDQLAELAAALRTTGQRALVLGTDVTQAHEAAAAVARTIDELGRLDILVNNAGVLVPGLVQRTAIADFERMVAVNQLGMVHMTHAALPHLLAAVGTSDRGVADIVNISSVSGRTAYAGSSGYSMTKFAVTGFSEAIRQELAAHLVRVSVIEPGAVATELVDHGTRAVTAQPLEPSDVAEAVVYVTTRRAGVAVNTLTIRPTDQVA